MKNSYVEKLKKLTLATLKGEKVKVILFGSRGRQDNHLRSDVDIGLLPQGKLDRRKVNLLKEQIEELNIPYKVEIVDFSTASPDFKKQAMKGGGYMEGLALRYKDALKALNTLKDIGQEPFSAIVRDAAIQRFENTFEAFWKFIREHLKQKEGIVANSPKACFKELFSLGLVDEGQTVELQEMTDKRNDTSHTYKEAVAQAIYEKIKGYALLIEKVLAEFKVENVRS